MLTPERTQAFDDFEVAEHAERAAEEDFNEKTVAAKAADDALVASKAVYETAVATTDEKYKALRGN